MANHDIATVREFMFCTWPQIIMVRLFWQLIKNKLTIFEKSPPQKIEFPLFCSPTNMSCLKILPSPPLYKEGDEETMAKYSRMDQVKFVEDSL